MHAISLFFGLIAGFSASAAVEYGLIEKSSDGNYQVVCPVREDGSVACRYTSGLQSATVVVHQAHLQAHQQNLRALEALGPSAFFGYEEKLRALVPTTNFLFNGFYVKYDSRTVLLGLAHFYSPVQTFLPTHVKSTLASVMSTLIDAYYAKAFRPNPLIKRKNRCPILLGRFECPRNSLVVTQLNYGVDELYVFKYSNRPAPFDFAANDAGMKNATDKFVATCSGKGLTLDGSLMRLTSKRDLEFVSGETSMVCRKIGAF